MPLKSRKSVKKKTKNWESFASLATEAKSSLGTQARTTVSSVAKAAADLSATHLEIAGLETKVAQVLAEIRHVQSN